MQPAKEYGNQFEQRLAISGLKSEKVYKFSVQVELKEEDTVHQMLEDMDLEKQNSLPSNHGQEEAISRHVFW